MTRQPAGVRAESDRLFLRDLQLDDVGEDYVSWLNDPEVNQYLESRWARHTLEDVRSYVSEHASSPDEAFLAICTKPSGKHIGNIKIGPIDRSHGTADIGLMIGDKTAWGFGYATEAISLATHFAFEELGLRRLTAGAYRENAGSTRAFERCGYRIEGLLREHRISGDRATDVVLVGILASEDLTQ